MTTLTFQFQFWHFVQLWHLWQFIYFWRSRHTWQFLQFWQFSHFLMLLTVILIVPHLLVEFLDNFYSFLNIYNSSPCRILITDISFALVVLKPSYGNRNWACPITLLRDFSCKRGPSDNIYSYTFSKTDFNTKQCKEMLREMWLKREWPIISAKVTKQDFEQ